MRKVNGLSMYNSLTQTKVESYELSIFGLINKTFSTTCISGVNWEDLHVMDFTTYKRPRKEYVLLPQPARTKNTRLRWWQPLNADWVQAGPQWAIDNVLIGQWNVISTTFCIYEYAVVHNNPLLLHFKYMYIILSIQILHHYNSHIHS